MMQIPLGKKMTNSKCKPLENRLNLPGRGSVKQSSNAGVPRLWCRPFLYSGTVPPLPAWIAKINPVARIYPYPLKKEV